MKGARNIRTRCVERASSVLRRWRKDASGTTAVEFSIIAFPFFAILGAIVEIAFVHYQSEMLDAAVMKAGRAMLTGPTQAASVTTANQFISTYLCPTTGRALPPNVDCNKLIVDVRPASSFVTGDTSKAMYKSASNVFCPGAPGQVVVMRVAYPLGALFPLNLFNRTAGVVNDVPSMSGFYHILMGVALFQEENYTSGFSPQAGC